MALFTGMYPAIFRKGIFKHLYFEKQSLIQKVDSSILLTCAINFGSYIDELDSGEDLFIKDSFPGIILFKNSLRNFDLDQDLIKFTSEELVKHLNYFQKTGSIILSNHRSGIIDYSSMQSLGFERNLFFYKDGIYADYQQTKKLASISGSKVEIEVGKSRLSSSREGGGIIIGKY